MLDRLSDSLVLGVALRANHSPDIGPVDPWWNRKPPERSEALSQGQVSSWATVLCVAR
jgi:hypothetical protein